MLAKNPAIERFRLFGMSDALERDDAVLGEQFSAIYPSSLLYLVSGLFEEEDADAAVDAPLLGLNRFFASSDVPDWITEPKESAAMQKVQTFFATHPNASVWSLASGGDGLATRSTSHGDFDRDADTLRSVIKHLG